MKRLLKALFIFSLSSGAFASDARLAADYGYFAINAKTNDKSDSISNPSAFRIGLLKPVTQKLEFSISYSILMADFSGSDLGYGLDVGANFYPFTRSQDEHYKDDRIEVKRIEIWKPYTGVYFHQRNFQSVKNSYAGFGVAAGVERFLNEKMNLRAEARMIQLAGPSDSTATETNLFVGVVFKL